MLVATPLTFLRALRETVRWGYGSHRGLLRHFGYFAEACALWRILRRERVTHVHAHFGTNATTVAMIAAVLGGVTFSFTLHGPLEFDSPLGISLGEKVARASFVAAITDFARSQAFRWSEPAHWSKVSVVGCGVDEQFLDAPIEPPPAAKRLVCVGRLGRSKGHAILIEACARLVAEGQRFELRLVGDGELRGLFEAMVRERGLGDTIAFLGWKSGEDVRDELLDSRALVLPSFGEGLPVVIMESLALARPAIATQIAGIPELVETGQTGWLVTSGSVEALVRAMREALAATPEQLFELGRAGRERVLAAHDARREAEKLAKLFASVLAAPGPDASGERSVYERFARAHRPRDQPPARLGSAADAGAARAARSVVAGRERGVPARAPARAAAALRRERAVLPARVRAARLRPGARERRRGSRAAAGSDQGHAARELRRLPRRARRRQLPRLGDQRRDRRAIRVPARPALDRGQHLRGAAARAALVGLRSRRARGDDLERRARRLRPVPGQIRRAAPARGLAAQEHPADGRVHARRRGHGARLPHDGALGRS